MALTKLSLLQRAGRQLRDTEFAIYSKALLSDGITDAQYRIKQRIPELVGMPLLINDTDILTYLPDQYSQLLWLMSCTRAMEMDERNNEAARYMNEFEAKLDELVNAIYDGTVVIVDGDGNQVEFAYVEDFVVDVKSNNTGIDSELEPVM